MNETTEKVRLKFRVSSTKDPKWTEKWGVSLTTGEEFHVTDKLLKLPFQENPPKTVCTFSVDAGSVLFQHLDRDRIVTRNGTPESACSPRVGDKILIGETILLEVLVAPTAKASARAAESPGPTLGGIPDILDMDSALKADGPTLTLTQFPVEAATAVALEAPPKNSSTPAVRSAPESPYMGGHSLEIQEPSLEMVRPDLSPPTVKKTAAKSNADAYPSAMPTPKTFGPAEPKIELANSPHTQRDDSLDERMAAMTESELDGVKPLYAEKAQLSGSKQSFSEKILSTVAAVLKRDDLNPPRDKFPLEKDATNPGIRLDRVEPSSRAAPKKTKSEFTASPQVNRNTAKPWIPEATPSGARLRGRAMIFLMAAGGTLMLVVGIMKISNQFGGASSAGSDSVVEMSQLDRGLPVEVIQDKVRKMSRRR